MAVICGLIFGGIVLTIVGYGIAVTIALFLDSICSNIDEEETEPIE